jgi:hypothetical protein
MSDIKMGKRYECINRDQFPYSCDQGDGAPKRKRCSFCKGELIVSEGRWGVFEWQKDGRYFPKEVRASYATRRAAERMVDVLYRDGGNYVVRWLPDICLT